MTNPEINNNGHERSTAEIRASVEIKRQEAIDRLEEATEKFGKMQSLLVNGIGTETERQSAEDLDEEIKKLKVEITGLNRELEALNNSN